MNARWVQAWLNCLAFYYLFFRASVFVVLALPALINVVLFGEQLKYFRLSFLGVIAVSGPPSVPGVRSAGAFQHDHVSPVEIVVLVVTAVLFLKFVGGAFRTLTGLAVAMLGQVARGCHVPDQGLPPRWNSFQEPLFIPSRSTLFPVEPESPYTPCNWGMIGV